MCTFCLHFSFSFSLLFYFFSSCFSLKLLIALSAHSKLIIWYDIIEVYCWRRLQNSFFSLIFFFCFVFNYERSFLCVSLCNGFYCFLLYFLFWNTFLFFSGWMLRHCITYFTCLALVLLPQETVKNEEKSWKITMQRHRHWHQCQYITRTEKKETTKEQSRAKNIHFSKNFALVNETFKL